MIKGLSVNPGSEPDSWLVKLATFYLALQWLGRGQWGQGGGEEGDGDTTYVVISEEPDM